jgi:hypothetical protein
MSQIYFPNSPTGTIVNSVTGGTGITVTPTTGAVVVSLTNSQVNSVTGGANITATPTTGAVVVSVSGTLPISVGGTNANSFSTTNGILKYNGTSLVSSSTALIDSNNILSNTSQPFLQAKVGSTPITDATGDGTTLTVVYDTIQAQYGNNYNNTTGVYTCPEAGVYIVMATIGWNNLTIAHTRSQIQLMMNSSAQVDTAIEASPGACQSALNVYVQSAHAIGLMGAGGTIEIQGFVAGSTKTVGILGEYFGNYSSLYIAKLF